MKTQLNVKIDHEVKNRAQHMAKEIGLSLSSVVNASLKQFARTGEMNLSATPTMTPHLEQIIADAEADLSRGEVHGPFSSGKELVKSLARKDV